MVLVPKDGKDHIGGNYSAYSSIASTIPNPLPDKWNANSIIFLMQEMYGVLITTLQKIVIKFEVQQV
jgi:hypothetical protein